MLLTFTDTFLCLDAAGWTAIFTLLLVLVTGALVLVTWNLWTSAQEQLREQRRTSALLSKPFLRAQDFRLADIWVDADQVTGIVYALKNIGDGSAWNVSVRSEISVDGTRINAEHFYAQLFIGKDMEFRIEVPLRGVDADIFLSTLELDATITFSDLEKEENMMHYTTRRNPVTGDWGTILKNYSI